MRYNAKTLTDMLVAEFDSRNIEYRLKESRNGTISLVREMGDGVTMSAWVFRMGDDITDVEFVLNVHTPQQPAWDWSGATAFVGENAVTEIADAWGRALAANE
jgi:hypothetical protein